MALVGEEALERGEWFELEIGKRVRYEVYEEMLRVSQLGPDAPAPLFTSCSRRRDKRRVTRFRPIIILNFVVLILTV